MGVQATYGHLYAAAADTLEGMGFARADAMMALEATEGNFEQAITALIPEAEE